MACSSESVCSLANWMPPFDCLGNGKLVFNSIGSEVVRMVPRRWDSGPTSNTLPCMPRQNGHVASSRISDTCMVLVPMDSAWVTAP